MDYQIKPREDIGAVSPGIGIRPIDYKRQKGERRPEREVPDGSNKKEEEDLGDVERDLHNDSHKGPLGTRLNVKA